jgi:hypothetical protein
MKKTILLSFALLLGTAVFAQVKKSTVKPGTATKAGTATRANVSNGMPAGNSAAACYLGKTWKLSKVEKFGVEKDPGDDQKTDMLQLNSDGTFKVILKGVEKTGTYTRGTWMTLKPADGSESMPYKIISCEGSTLKADWRDGDTHNNFTYTAQ